jgi:hypothetical protein
MLFYISLPTWSNIKLCTMVDRERFSVFRVDHWVQKSGHPWPMWYTIIILSYKKQQETYNHCLQRNKQTRVLCIEGLCWVNFTFSKRLNVDLHWFISDGNLNVTRETKEGLDHWVTALIRTDIHQRII